MKMSAVKEEYYDCSFVSIHYIICECGETFPSENGLRAHLEKEHPHKRERKEFKCGVCGSIFNTEAGCVAHYEAEHFADTDIKQEPQDEELPLLDELDHKQEIQIEFQEDDQTEHQYETEYQDELAEEQDYQQHYQEEMTQEMTHEEMTHEEMTQEEMTHEEMTQEEMIHEEMTEEEMAQHGVMSHNTVSQAETVQATQTLVKAIGNKQYPQVRAPPLKMVRDADTGQLVLVFNRARPLKKHAKLTNKPKQANEIVCELCGKKYASNAALKYHQRVHTGEKPYHCHLCPKAFTMPLFLQIHVRTHTGERPFQCAECPKAFSNKAALLRHERVHTGEKPYSCPMCFKSFTQSNSMKLHVATVHLKQPAPYKSRRRRLKEVARGVKHRPTNKIAAFAPARSGSPTASTLDQHSEGEYEVVISEEVQDGACYEVIYEDEE